MNPNLSKDLREEILMYVESAYLHALPVENLDTGELEHPHDIADVEWIADHILALIRSRLPSKRKDTKPGYHYRVCTPNQRENRGFNACLKEINKILE